MESVEAKSFMASQMKTMIKEARKTDSVQGQPTKSQQHFVNSLGLGIVTTPLAGDGAGEEDDGTKRCVPSRRRLTYV